MKTIDKTKEQIAYYVQYWKGDPKYTLADTSPDGSGYYFTQREAYQDYYAHKSDERILSMEIYKGIVIYEPNIIHEPGYGDIDIGHWEHKPDTEWDYVTGWIRPGYEQGG